MPFGSRNSYYLRISETNVLPLYVYLDERHLDWMSDRILQHVLADIRPLIIQKLQAEAGVHLGPGATGHTKKGTVDVHRGDFYQFCFFFRKTEPHSVLIKARHFAGIPVPKTGDVQKGQERPTSTTSSRKRKNRITQTDESDSGRKKRKAKGKGKTRRTIDDEDVLSISSGDSDHSVVEVDHSIQGMKNIRRSSRRSQKMAAGGYQDRSDSETPDGGREGSFELVESGPSDDEGPTCARTVEHEPVSTGLPESTTELGTNIHESSSRTQADSATVDIELEEDEEKPKPTFKLGYSNFSIYDRCLCVVVEPWPPLPKTTKELAVTELPSMSLRAQSFAPPESADLEADCPDPKNPLFLVEFDSNETSFVAAREKMLIGVNNFSASTIQHTRQDGQDEDDGMIQFSQVLKSAGNFRTGVTDDDEMDGEAFLGDADEAREP